MGDRYVLEIICQQCGFRDDDVYYAPTCGFTDWTCQKCGHVIDLEEYTGISYEEALNETEVAAQLSTRADFAKRCPECGGESYHTTTLTGKSSRPPEKPPGGKKKAKKSK